jgi:6,7-dimethyl-8-ribityllumazine synthase
MAELIGRIHGQGVRIALVCARFNELITRSLEQGARTALLQHGVEEIDTIWVPGAFEIPTAVRAITDRYDAIVCLGAVIRGSTPHFDYVCQQAASGIGRLAVESGIPILFGVLTTDTLEQALERAGSKMGNKGAECACAALEMVDLLRRLK